MPPDHLQKPLRTFAVVHKIDPDAHACLTNNAEDIAVFMLGRGFGGYQLYVNGRKYDWDKSSDVSVQERHLKYCLELDKAFYPHD